MKPYPFLPTILELAAAAGAAVAVHTALPLPADDPFRSSLVILPLVVAALRALERRAPRTASHRRGTGTLDAVALGVLVLLTLGRQSLGLAATDWFLAGGFLLLLAKRIALLVLRLRPLLGVRLPRRPDLAFFLLPLVVYLALQPWMSGHRQADGDEPYYLLLTHSLVHDLDADLADDYAGEEWRAFMDRPIAPQPGDPMGPDGEVWSRHNLLLPLVLAPAYWIAGRWGVLAFMAVLTAVLAWMVLRLAAGYAEDAGRRRPGAALLVWALFAFAPPLLTYSYQIWIEVPAALLAAVALDQVLALRRGEATPRRLAGLVACLILLPLLKLRLGLVALPLAVLAWRARPDRRLVVAAAGVLSVAFGALLVHNQLRFGNFLKIHRVDELQIYSRSVADFARGAVGMFYDTAFGLFPSAPIWLLLLPGLVLLWRRRDPLLNDLIVLTPLYLATLAPRFEWYGGWSPPFRYPLVFLPFIALALVPLFEARRRPGMAFLLTALGALTLVLTLIWVIIPGWTYNFADGRTYLLDGMSERLAADVARLFPSTVRPRLATWLWPLASLAIIPLAGLGGQRPGGARPGGARRARAWGFVAVLLAVTAVPVLAARWPTGKTELEDPYLRHQGGQAFPQTWVVERPRYRSGWLFGPRTRVEVPVVAGGKRVRLRVVAYRTTPDVPARLRVAAGGQRLAILEVMAGDWQTIDLGPFDWPAGEPLVLFGGGRRMRGVVAVDRVIWNWE